MRYYETNGHVGPNGDLWIRMPSDYFNADVDIRIGASNANGSAPAPMSREEWQEFVKRTAGSIPDFPDVERAGPEGFERRESLD